jgi:two-component system, OmpR family, sensor kinase
MLVTAMLLAVILLFGVIMYITRGILAPLLKLVACMHKLAGNDIEITIPGVQRDDEIGAMARAVSVFRDNAVALADSQRRLIEQAAALEKGLEHERRLTAQQRDFVSMTSHEFLTPLTIIDGHAQRLIKMSDRLDAGDITERGSSIRTAVHRITGIMDSLLGASRILDGPAVFHPSEIDPGGVLREACQAHRDATHRIAITEDIAPLPSMIHGDSKLLFHAFSNLISNAIKYSPSGSTVEVTARQESEWLVVQVRDSGIGIPARDREHLFERYFRGSNATGIAGTGVGLHLVSMVVALHHGEVFAESLEGVGSRFTVRLPSLCSAFFGAILSVVGFGAMSARAENADAPADARLDTIVVTAKKHPEPAADEQVKRQVETALHSDPFFYDEHVSVTIINGVVTLHGIVFDDWDLRIAMRIAKRMPGVKRVVNDLEIKMGGE